MTQHATNGLTTLTQSKTNVGAIWSRTLALGLETHNNSNSGSSGSTDNFSSIMANFGRIDIQANIYKQLKKMLLTHRSCFYDRVSAKTAENGDRTEKIRTPDDLNKGGHSRYFT